MEFSIREELLAPMIGQEILKYVRREGFLEKLSQKAESKKHLMLEKIRQVLDDGDMEDPECFLRIEAIMAVFEEEGVSIFRHDW